MAKQRKTRSERNQERDESERRAWEIFRPKVDALQSHKDAIKLLAEAPAPDASGRQYYANLGFFLRGFTPPAGSSHAEMVLYVQLMQRMDAAGELKPGVRETVEQTLRHALDAQGNW